MRISSTNPIDEAVYQMFVNDDRMKTYAGSNEVNSKTKFNTGSCGFCNERLRIKILYFK